MDFIVRKSLSGLVMTFLAVAVVSAAEVYQNVNQVSDHLLVAPRSSGPLILREGAEIKAGTATLSTNWSGYAVTGAAGAVTDVQGSWIVPTVNCSGSSEAATGGLSAFWVGIDGWGSPTVEQIGTDSDCISFNDAPRTPTYFAWFEFFPSPRFFVSEPGLSFDQVRPGDVMSAEVKVVGSNALGTNFLVTITDKTQDWTFSETQTVAGAKQASAEWIAEAPGGCDTTSGICPLADFKTVDFGSAFTGVPGTSDATVNGVTGRVGSFANLHELTMASEPAGAFIMAQPSALSGGSFSVNWLNEGP